MIGTAGEKEQLSPFPGSATKGRSVCVSIHPVPSARAAEDAGVIHLASTVDGHYLSVVCLCVSAVIESRHSLKHRSQLIDVSRLAIMAESWTF